MSVWFPSQDIIVPGLGIPGRKPTSQVTIKQKYRERLVFAELFRGSLINMSDGFVPSVPVGVSHSPGYWTFVGATGNGVSYGEKPELEGISEFSIVTKVRFHDQLADQAIISKVGSPPVWYGDGFILFADKSGPTHSNTIEIYTANGATTERVSAGNNTITPDEWQTIGATYKSLNTIRLWRNGVEVEDSPVAISGNADVAVNDVDLVVGGGNGVFNKDLNGDIEYIYLFNAELTAEEILRISRNPYGEVLDFVGPKWLPFDVGGIPPGLEIPIAYHHYSKNIGN